jgi:hypothetical protein
MTKLQLTTPPFSVRQAHRAQEHQARRNRLQQIRYSSPIGGIAFRTFACRTLQQMFVGLPPRKCSWACHRAQATVDQCLGISVQALPACLYTAAMQVACNNLGAHAVTTSKVRALRASRRS